jgi:hypothetical protein
VALPDVTKIVAPVWDNPDDDGLRAVIGDTLLEAGHPWGELIALQLRIAEGKATGADKKLALKLVKRHRNIIGGPIAKIANTVNNWVCDKGFLVECDLHRRLVKRPDYEAAAGAPQWTTVKKVHVSILHTPQWWITLWVKSAPLKRLREVDISGLVIVRESPGKPWRIVKASQSQFFGGYVAAFANGLSTKERERFEFGPDVKPTVRSELEEAMRARAAKP